MPCNVRSAARRRAPPSRQLPSRRRGRGRGIRPHASGRCAFVTEEMGLMRRKIICRMWLLSALSVLVPGMAWAQVPDYAPPDPVIPLPLYSTQPAMGGLYAAGSYVMLRQTNPLRDQLIAVRGFIAVDESVLG